MLKININNISILETGETLIQNIIESFEPGTCYALLGKNGSGKSTLFSTICNVIDTRLFNVDAESLFNGFNLILSNKISTQKFRQKQIRYVFQDSLNAFNPLKKLQYFFEQLDVKKLEIDLLLEYFELPNFDELKTKHIYELSGGMAQRIQILLALLAKPKYLFLDEPTSALDYPIVNLISNKLKEYTKTNDCITITITQDAKFALHYADRIGILKNKQISKFHKSEDLELEWIVSQISKM